MKISVYLKALSDTNKMRIIQLLMERDICVQQLERILQLKQANISKHLMTLKRLKMVECRKDKTRIFYSLSPVFTQEFAGLLKCMQTFRQFEPILLQDQQALATLSIGCEGDEGNFVDY